MDLISSKWSWQCAICRENQPLANIRQSHVDVIHKILDGGQEKLPQLDNDYLLEQVCVDCGAPGFIYREGLNNPHDINSIQVIYEELLRSLLVLRFSSGFLLPNDFTFLLENENQRNDKVYYTAIDEWLKKNNWNCNTIAEQVKTSLDPEKKIGIFNSNIMLAHDHPFENYDTDDDKLYSEEDLENAYFCTKASAHPERPDRIRSIICFLVTLNLWSKCQVFIDEQKTAEKNTMPDFTDLINLGVLTAQEINNFQRMIDRFNSFSGTALALNKGDTYWSQFTLAASRIACNCAKKAVDEIVSGNIESGFLIVRPPGHHADACQSSGFCVVNNIGVAAAYAKSKENVKKILIVDWDIHHGNGTENMFYEDDSVLLISIHRYDQGRYYPASGHLNKTGANKGAGFNVNIPLDGDWCSDADYLLAFDEIVMPIAAKFKPDIILISSGFDAAMGDYLGDFNLSPWGYAEMTRKLMQINKKILVFLEGGYNLHSVAIGSEMIVRTLMGQPVPPRVECFLLGSIPLGGEEQAIYNELKFSSKKYDPDSLPFPEAKESTIAAIASLKDLMTEYWEF